MARWGRWLRVCGAAVLLTLVVVVTTQGSSVKSSKMTTAAFLRFRRLSREAVRAELLTELNNQRQADSKKTLCMNNKLMHASQEMAEDMARTDYFGDTGVDTSSPAERVSRQKFVFTTLTEDVAAGYDNAADALAALLKVNEHRDNLLGDYSYVGVGYAYDRSKGYRHYWVINLANALREHCDESDSQGPSTDTTSFWRRWLSF